MLVVWDMVPLHQVDTTATLWVPVAEADIMAVDVMQKILPQVLVSEDMVVQVILQVSTMHAPW